MRRRVLIPSILLGLITVIVVLIAAGNGVAVARTHEAELQRMSAITEIVKRAEVAVNEGDAGQLRSYLARFTETHGDAVAVVDARGEVIASSGAIDPRSDAAQQVALAAARSVPQRSIPTILPWSPPTALLAEPFEGTPGVAAGAVLIETHLHQARADITTAWTLMALMGFVLLTLLLLALHRWTNWILRPVHALDRATRAIAEHRALAVSDRTGPPELRRLARSFARMAESVETALEQQRGFVAEASHQLRNPLAAIRLRIDTLADDAETAAIDADLDRLEHIVDRMLVLANAEHRATVAASGEPRAADTQRLDFTEHTSAAELAAVAIAPTRLNIIAEDDTRVPVRGAFADLVEITEILLENAAKYAGQAPTVRIRLEAEGGAVVLEVCDDGPGLDSAALEQVGSRFWRAPQHQQLPGTGLGLAIVQQLARAHDGDMHVDRAESGGLRVRVTVVPQ